MNTFVLIGALLAVASAEPLATTISSVDLCKPLDCNKTVDTIKNLINSKDITEMLTKLPKLPVKIPIADVTNLIKDIQSVLDDNTLDCDQVLQKIKDILTKANLQNMLTGLIKSLTQITQGLLGTVVSALNPTVVGLLQTLFQLIAVLDFLRLIL